MIIPEYLCINKSFFFKVIGIFVFLNEKIKKNSVKMSIDNHNDYSNIKHILKNLIHIGVCGKTTLNSLKVKYSVVSN